MGIILFVLGLPSSGESVAARYIKSFAKRKKFQARRFKDYTHLHKMFQRDKEAKRFRPTQPQEYDSFDVLDFAVLDEALQKLHHNILRHNKLADDSKELLIIEFSRDDYYEALSFFSSLGLRHAQFLFINSDILSCKARIKARAKHPRTLDDRYVSDHIFEAYYKRDQQQYLKTAMQFNQRFDIPLDHIHVIQNGSDITIQEFFQKVEVFANDMLKIKI